MNKNTCSRSDIILHNIDINKKFGLEISPSFNPVLPKKSFNNIKTCDYYDEKHLKNRYKDDKNVDFTKIEKVDYILKDNNLSTIIKEKFDFIIASHVIEHTTDVITFINECSKVLNNNGILYLAIPDKRYMFDFFRPISSPGNILQAFIEKRKTHPQGTLYDNISLSCTYLDSIAWLNSTDINQLKLMYDINNIKETYESLDYSIYNDTHEWVFTPSSFKLIFFEMQNISLITNNLYIKSITPSIGYCEFYVQLIKNDIDIDKKYSLTHKKQLLIDIYNELKNINGENTNDITNNGIVVNDLYIQEAPNEENKINIFKNEWVSSLPQFEDISGNINLFGDERIHWLMSRIKLFNKNVLELGPLEGGHSYMLEKIGGAQVISIEQNQKNFMKCLIVKNIYNLNTKYIFGDFNKFFINNKNFFDIILASGVLYHQIKPISLLQNISKVTNNVFIWTHYFNSIRDDISYQFDDEIEQDFLGEKFILYKHNYGMTNNPTFCGGSLPFSMWMKRDDIINVLKLLEFKNIEIAFDDKQHPNGSAFALFATKK